MTTDLEKTFFDTFRIEKIEYTQCNLIDCKNIYHDCNNCPFHNVYKIDYPQITDRHYLELICMVMNIFDGIQNVYIDYSVEKVKERTLKLLITAKDDVYSQVQALFKGDK